MSTLARLALAGAAAALLAWLAPETPAIDVPPAAPVSLAFWGFLALVGSWIWTGIQVAGRLTLTALSWSVKALWATVIKIKNFGREIGLVLVRFGKASWDFLEAAYTHVLKPAVLKFWELVDRLRGWLDKVFGPVLEFLQAVRRELLGFYTKWIRPVLDIIGIARKAIRVLGLLHFEWARKLDSKLGDLEERIDAPFRFVLGKLNELITVVNRIVTADGLFQRLALIRSLQRDAAIAFESLLHAIVPPVDDAELQRKRAREYVRLDPHTSKEALREFYVANRGPLAPVVAEMVPVWLVIAGLRQP